MFRRLKAALRRSEADKLATVLDAQRAEQRNAESHLQRLRELRDTLMARGSEEARIRLDATRSGNRDRALNAPRGRCSSKPT